MTQGCGQTDPAPELMGAGVALPWQPCDSARLDLRARRALRHAPPPDGHGNATRAMWRHRTGSRNMKPARRCRAGSMANGLYARGSVRLGTAGQVAPAVAVQVIHHQADRAPHEERDLRFLREVEEQQQAAD